MLLVIAFKRCLDTRNQFLGGEETIRVDYPPLSRDPSWLLWTEPGMVDWKRTHGDLHSLPPGLDLQIMPPNPLKYLSANMPRGVVAHEQQRLLAKLLKLAANPLQELGGSTAHWTAIHKTQPHFFFWPRIQLRQLNQDSIPGQSPGIGGTSPHRLLDKAQRSPLHGPGRQARSGQSAPPGLILEANHPIEVACHRSNHSVAGLFPWGCSRSGLVIHIVARFHCTPSPGRAARIISSGTRIGVNPLSKLTFSASYSVHELVGMPKGLGLWCSTVRSLSAPWVSKAAWIAGRTDERLCKDFRPCLTKARIALSAFWSEQPNWWAIWRAFCPRPLTIRMWRRNTRMSDECKPISNCWRSVSLNGRMKIGPFMLPVTHNLKGPCLVIR